MKTQEHEKDKQNKACEKFGFEKKKRSKTLHQDTNL